ncbi:MAG: hypothetical protein ACHRXM_37340 [Isosphaerales bacterium]
MALAPMKRPRLCPRISHANGLTFRHGGELFTILFPQLGREPLYPGVVLSALLGCLGYELLRHPRVVLDQTG